MGDQEKVKEPMERQNSETKLTGLVVDDDKLVRMIHQGLLKRAGVKNEAVKNGKEAVDIHYSGQRFDIILMDKEMPIMTGIEVHNFKALFFLIHFCLLILFCIFSF
jgi:response regulator RpfG family c-di-GMP phosphodiesterase